MNKLVSISLAVLVAVGAGADEEAGLRARRLNQETFVFDAHCDTVMRLTDGKLDFSRRSSDGHLDLPRMSEGGLNAQVFALWVEEEFWPGHATKRTLQLADAVLRTLDKHPDRLGLALTAEDALSLRNQNRIAVFLGIEGGHAIEDDLAVLRMFHRLGVRVMTLTWWKNTNWADASGDKPRHDGLTPFGTRVVQEMNRLGMVIDVSHASDKTFYDVLAVTSKPVIASHSCCRTICGHHRNLSDDMLRALKKNGGVIGVNYAAGFLDVEAGKVIEAAWEKITPAYLELKQKYGTDVTGLRKELHELMAKHLERVPEVPLDRLIEHIDHAVEVAGVDHVGLGSDFDGISTTPRGLEDVSHLPRITEKLLQRGYSRDDIGKILGGNLLRVFREVIGK